ncbi:MAG: hypothetical protein QXL15_01230 [Candidatus Korarchaeota archaeon]
MSEDVKPRKHHCPKCNSTHVLEEEDKTVVVRYTPVKMYKKYFRCGDCGHKWE